MSFIAAVVTVSITNQFDAEYFRRNIMAKGQQRKNPLV
jgi:hypothetical protein